MREVLRWRWAFLTVAALATVAVTVVVVAFPSVAATTCPSCYGMEELGANLYVEPSLSPAQRTEVAEVIGAARRRVGDFYGGRESAPSIIACLTEVCYHRIGGGGERGVGVLNRAVMLSPRGVNPVIASHEMSHVELRHRLGSDRDRVPQWFDEGLAVVVSEDPRYLAPQAAPDRCLVSSEDVLPVALADWVHAASADQQLYAKAACRVSRWIGAHGGPPAVLALVQHLRAGESFAAVVQR